MISGIHYEVDVNCALLGYYAVSCVKAQKKIQTNKQTNKVNEVNIVGK